jgi:hypothetical protein
MRVQRGKHELLDPATITSSELRFEFELTANDEDSPPNFTGKYSQGPKDARFVYVNSGTYAGEGSSCWSRRAKLSLMSITKQQIDVAASEPTLCFETVMPGTGRDGGPTCASVKGIEWRVVKK